MTADGSVWTAAPLLLDPLLTDDVSNRRGFINSSRGRASATAAARTSAISHSASTAAGKVASETTLSQSAKLLPGLARRVWCVVSGGTQAALATGGQRDATVTVRFTASAEPLTLRLPLLVTMATLPPATGWLGYLGSAPLYPDAVWPDVNAQPLLDLSPSLQLLRDNGNTAATGGVGGPAYSGRNANGSLALNFTLFDVSMAAITKAFPGVPINTYGGTNLEGTFADSKDLTAVATAVAAHIKSRGWPAVYESVADEPGDVDTIAADDAAAAAIAAGGGNVFKSIAFTSFVDPSDIRTYTHHCLPTHALGWAQQKPHPIL